MLSLRSRFDGVLLLLLPAFALFAGCGGGAHSPVAPPGGGFSASDLNGTYVFSSVGADSQQGAPLVIVGAFAANGNQGITSGNVDVISPTFGVRSSTPITGGNYSVNSDGRGKVSLTSSTVLPENAITLDFVLSTSSHGVITEYDSLGSGSGTLDLQSEPTQAQLAGANVFNLAGMTQLGANIGLVGVVTLDSTGTVTTGVADENVGAAANSFTLSTTSDIAVGTPGTAVFSANGTSFTFNVYPIDSTHLKFIETDTQAFMSGDVFNQTSTSFPSGELVFSMAGEDVSAGLPLVVGGMVNSNGSSALSAGVEDYDDGGSIDATGTTITPLAFSGSLVQTGGRWLASFDGFMNGNGGVNGNYTFAAYPSSGGVQLLEIDQAGITQGTAYSQTSTTFATGQGYGLNLTAVNQSSEEDDIVEFTNTGNNLTGLIDQNDQGATNSPQNFTGSYTADTTNLGRGLITSGFFTIATYTVDSSTTIGIEVDTTQLGLATIGLQSASQSAIASRFASLRAMSKGHGKWKKRQ